MKLQTIQDYNKKIWSDNEKVLLIKTLNKSNVFVLFATMMLRSCSKLPTRQRGFYNFEDSSLKIGAVLESWHRDIFML